MDSRLLLPAVFSLGLLATSASLLRAQQAPVPPPVPQPPPAPVGTAQPVAGESTSLTIYSAARPGGVPPEMYQPGMQENVYGVHWRQQIPGYAIVRQDRPLTLEAGRSTVRFREVAAMIDPTTVSFASLTDPTGTRVLEQSFEFDLVSTQKLMERFLDREVTIEQSVGDKIETYTGVLLSAQGGLVLKMADGGVRVVNGYTNVRFPELPGGLLTKPTLVWSVATDKPGEHKTRVAYETKGITWWSDYNVVFAEGKDANSGLLDIGAWVSVLNQSGGTYREAKLKLIAGDVGRAPQPQPMAKDMRMQRGVAAAEMADGGFEEKAFFEYHLYTLGRPATIPDRSTKQIELFPTARQVPCEKVMVYYGLENRYPYYGAPMVDRNFGVESNKKVDTYLQFKNKKDIGMGMPLPSGRIRVSKLDAADGSLEFIGEDAIDHTPKDESVLIKMGSAFDVVGERVQTDFKVDTGRKRMEEKIEIKIRNHKDEKVNVIAKENLYRWTGWEITEKSHPFEKFDSRTVHFPVEVEKDGEVTIRYTVVYTW